MALLGRWFRRGTLIEKYSQLIEKYSHRNVMKREGHNNRSCGPVGNSLERAGPRRGVMDVSFSNLL